ncbi:MAG TPA: electron transfer flavoprotein subunit alpha/FixB family protein [Acidimicrobiia bacterium]|jgi:electron transfer flavoprotein alpha subunit|nr:electron transfer flavoprotein subunit alpha/FixB family protein [Acidimicrobiia bacterium]
MSYLYLVEHDRGELNEASLGGLTATVDLAERLGAAVHVALLGDAADDLVAEVSEHGPAVVHRVHHELLADYGPDAWAAALHQLGEELGASAYLATGTDRGNEVLAHVAAKADLAMVANCIEITETADAWEMKRLRWGGSLHEIARLEAPVKIATFAAHTTEPTPRPGIVGQIAQPFVPELGDAEAVTLVRDRVVTAEGVTLATAPVVVSGGRGVGSAEAFAALEELAELLNGVVGCSRVVTNNGWRPHSDQVGQTGTVVAPDLYIACGISGAVQHWVGMMNAKHVLAINTDAEAPMVTKANWAVVADLHAVLPAVSEEIKRRHG